MKILYDISILGMGHFDKEYRSGIFRVVENVAKELVKLPQCQVSFCSFHHQQTVFRSLDYLKATKEFSHTPFAAPDNSFFKKKKHQYRMGLIENKLNGSERLPGVKKLLLRAGFQYERVRQKMYSYGDYQYLPLTELDKADIYHTPFYPISKEVKNAHVKSRFITCYDLIPIYKPEFCHSGVIERMNVFLDSLTTDTWIVCISQSARNELLNYMGNRIDPNKAVVTELAASSDFYKSTDIKLNAMVRKRYGIPDGPFILSLCTLEPRKNISRAVDAFTKLVEQQHLSDLCLVLVGNKGFNANQLIDDINCDPNIKSRITITGFVADADLAPLYSEALFFVYPSLYEGFGLPPLEAMQCGTPVITSNATSLPEVVGDAGIMINPTDTDALCQAMWSIYSQPALRQLLSEKAVLRAPHFSWKRCAEETAAAYKKSLSS